MESSSLQSDRGSPPLTCNRAPTPGNVWDAEPANLTRLPAVCMRFRLSGAWTTVCSTPGAPASEAEPRPAPAHPARAPPRAPPPTHPTAAQPQAGSGRRPRPPAGRAPLRLGARSQGRARRGPGASAKLRVLRVNGALGRRGEGGRLQKGRGASSPERDLPS